MESWTRKFLDQNRGWKLAGSWKLQIPMSRPLEIDARQVMQAAPKAPDAGEWHPGTVGPPPLLLDKLVSLVIQVLDKNQINTQQGDGMGLSFVVCSIPPDLAPEPFSGERTEDREPEDPYA